MNAMHPACTIVGIAALTERDDGIETHGRHLLGEDIVHRKQIFAIVYTHV
jgi:hypothetical protein